MKYLILIPALLAGCATVTRGSSGNVDFTSEPAGATVELSNGLSCVTPCSVRLKRRDTVTAVFKLNGQERQVFVDTRVAGSGAAGVAGNVLIGGVVGLAVDAATGAALEHFPNPAHADFTVPPGAPAPAAETATQPTS